MEHKPELSRTIRPADEILRVLEKHFEVPEGALEAYLLIGVEKNIESPGLYRFVSSSTLDDTEAMISFVSDYFMERVMLEGKFGEARETPGQTPPTE